jgi:ribulose-phosphate 3-epimerase
MIEQPENLLEVFAKAGASRIIVHVETCPHLHRTLQQIKSLGCAAGVTLNPSTPAVAIQPVLGMVDQVLVMSVNPGFGGQKFIPESVDKIREIRGMLDRVHAPARLEVDGGVSSSNLRLLRDAGADTFVSGSFVFHHPQGIAAGIRALREECVAPSRAG